MESDRVIYIAGPITKDPDYYQKFLAAEDYFTQRGLPVLNPAKIFNDVAAAGVNYKRILNFCVLLVGQADALALLPDWKQSYGANAEYTAYKLHHKHPYIMQMGLQQTELGWQADLLSVEDEQGG